MKWYLTKWGIWWAFLDVSLLWWWQLNGRWEHFSQEGIQEIYLESWKYVFSDYKLQLVVLLMVCTRLCYVFTRQCFSNHGLIRALLNIEMERNEPEWGGMDRNEPEWHRNGPEWTGMTPEWKRNGPEWTGMNRNDTGMDRNGPEWTEMDRNEPEWHRNGPEWTGMTPE